MSSGRRWSSVVLLLLVQVPLLVLASVAVAMAQASPQAARRPNIVFVLVDDQRWDEVRASGHPFAETPHMDRLAREGSRFLNTFATTPLCSPSRASFLTGQHPHTHCCIANTSRPTPVLATFPR